MTDIPIIFSGPMVLALLRGWKSQTRRLAWRKNGSFVGDGPASKGYKVTWANVGSTPIPMQYAPSPWQRVKAGDRLWVREAHYVWSARNQDGTGRRIEYRADSPGAPCTWTPGIHMPRFASRLTLECVADARVEPLKAITRDDAIAEGATSRPNCHGFMYQNDGWSMDWSAVGTKGRFASGPDSTYAEREICLGDPVAAFGAFINELHGGPRWNLKPSNIWDENPDVAVLTFKAHLQNIDSLPAPRAAA